MRVFFESLSEKDRRRYAGMEAARLGHGGVEYVARVLGCDPKTVRRGRTVLAAMPADPAGDRVRKKGAADGQMRPVSTAGPGRSPSR
jgi:hypothetical protein